MKENNTGNYNSAVPRYTKAFQLIDNKCVVLLNHPHAVVHSLDGKNSYYVDYINAVCGFDDKRGCEDFKYRHELKDGFKCKHVLASQIQAGVIQVVKA